MFKKVVFLCLIGVFFIKSLGFSIEEVYLRVPMNTVDRQKQVLMSSRDVRDLRKMHITMEEMKRNLLSHSSMINMLDINDIDIVMELEIMIQEIWHIFPKSLSIDKDFIKDKKTKRIIQKLDNELALFNETADSFKSDFTEVREIKIKLNELVNKRNLTQKKALDIGIQTKKESINNYQEKLQHAYEILSKAVEEAENDLIGLLKLISPIIKSDFEVNKEEFKLLNEFLSTITSVKSLIEEEQLLKELPDKLGEDFIKIKDISESIKIEPFKQVIKRIENLLIYLNEMCGELKEIDNDIQAGIQDGGADVSELIRQQDEIESLVRAIEDTINRYISDIDSMILDMRREKLNSAIAVRDNV